VQRPAGNARQRRRRTGITDAGHNVELQQRSVAAAA